MAKITNPWVGYLDRSYKDIKLSLLNRIGKIAPEMSDHSESNIMVIIIDAIAGVTETLNYYIDNVARESFITTARRYSSVVRLSRLVDYQIKSNIAASVDIYVYLYGADGLSVQSDTTISIPLGTKFYDSTGISFLSTRNETIEIGQSSVIIPCKQVEIVTGSNLGKLRGVKDETLLLPEDYSHDSLDITIEGQEWFKKETLAFSTSEDLHFIVEVSTEKRAYLKFGDNIRGQIPPGNFDVISNYYITKGVQGNIDANLIKQSDFDFKVGNITRVDITNTNSSSGGNGYETLENIKKSVPLSIRTLERAVTKQDYIDIGSLAPGVLITDVDFKCGDFYISLYVYPINGGITSQALLDSTLEYFDTRISFPMVLRAFPMGESKIIININVTGNPRKKAPVIRGQILAALGNKFGVPNKKISRNIRNSDIIAEVDNQESVDFLNLVNFFIVPFIKPVEHVNNITPVSFIVSNHPTEDTKFTIKYDNLIDKFFLYSKGFIIDELVKNQNYTHVNNLFSITLPTISFVGEFFWEFTIYKKGDVTLIDYSVPIFDAVNSIINITEIN